MKRLLVAFFCLITALSWPGRAFCAEAAEMDAFRKQLGYADFSADQLSRAREASELLGRMDGIQALAIWEELEKSLPGNLAVCYGLLRAADYETHRPFNHASAQTMERLQNVLERSEKAIVAAVLADPDAPVPRIIHAEMLFRKWLRTFTAEFNANVKPDTPKPYSLPESDALLEAMLDAFAEARAHVGEDKEIKAALHQRALVASQYVAERLRTARSSHAVNTLGRLAMELKEEPEVESLGEKFARLNDEAKAWSAVAIHQGATNEETLKEYGFKALENYRRIARLGDIPWVPFRLVWGKTPVAAYADSLLEAMMLMESLAEAEEDPDKRQALLDESLNVFVARYLEVSPDVQDWHDGGYAVAWHYMSLADLTPFQEKKAAYVKLARERLVYNVSFGDEYQGTEFWRGILEDFDARTAEMLLNSNADGSR